MCIEGAFITKSVIISSNLSHLWSALRPLADPPLPCGHPPPSMGGRAGAVLAVVTAPSHRGEGWGGVCSPKNLYIPLCAVQGGENLVSSRLGPRMESAVNMNEQVHDNMSASHGRCENGKENEKT